jgi:hypothetical protein
MNYMALQQYHNQNAPMTDLQAQQQAAANYNYMNMLNMQQQQQYMQAGPLGKRTHNTLLAL